MAHILDQRRRARGAPVPLDVTLPDDPRIRDQVLVPNRLDRYDRLARSSSSKKSDGEVGND